MAYLFIKHRCTRIETLTSEQEEVEPEIMGDDTSVVNHDAASLTPYFGSMKYMCLDCA